MRIGFVTCVQLGLSCMEEIYALGAELHLAVTLPDDRARSKSGRVFIEPFCRDHAIPLRHIRNINDAEAISAIRDAALDWLCIIGWSQIAKLEVLATPRRGCLGMHPTLLPEGRGRAAIPWAIIKGLSETGVTLFQLTEGVDSGPVLAQERIPLAPRETAGSLYGKVAVAHRTLIRRVWPALLAGTVPLKAQDEAAATYWPGRSPEDGRLSPNMPVSAADRLVRAVTRPYPGAFLDAPTHRMRIWAAHPATEADGVERVRFSNGDLALDEWSIEPLPGDDPRHDASART